MSITNEVAELERDAARWRHIAAKANWILDGVSGSSEVKWVFYMQMPAPDIRSGAAPVAQQLGAALDAEIERRRA